MSGHIVMVEKPVVLSLVWTFVPNVLPLLRRSFTIELAADGFIRGYEFLVDNTLDVEKKKKKDHHRQ